MKKKTTPLTREEFYSQTAEAYQYAQEVAKKLKAFHRLIQSKTYFDEDKKKLVEVEAMEISKVLQEIALLKANLQKLVTPLEAILEDCLDPNTRISPLPQMILKSCDRLVSFLTSIASLRTPPYSSLPIEGLRIDLVDEKFWATLNGEQPTGWKKLAFDYWHLDGDFMQSNVSQFAREDLDDIWRQLPAILAYRNSLSAPKPKPGRGAKTDFRSRNSKELLIAALLEHHRFNHRRQDLELTPASTGDLAKMIQKSPATVSRAFKDLGIDYEKYERLCGNYRTIREFLARLDNPLAREKSNRETSIRLSEDADEE
jgi:hypothetical protein